MKKRKKKSRPSKDPHKYHHPPPQPQQPTRSSVRVEEDSSNLMGRSDLPIDDESTMEGYDTEGYRQPQSSNESNLNDGDAIDTTDDKRPSLRDHCLPLASNGAMQNKKQNQKHRQKNEQTRKRGRPPKIRNSEKLASSSSINHGDLERETDEHRKKQCLDWSLEDRCRTLPTSVTHSFNDWNVGCHQSSVTKTLISADPSDPANDFCQQSRTQGPTLSENFVPFQIKQTTTKDKENNSNRIDENSGNIIEIVCGPNRGLMYLSRLSLATGERCKTKCIHFNDRWWTPSEFQMTSGRGAAKDWKRTIRHGDKCLKALLESGILKLNLCNKNACFCESCFSSSQPANNGDVAKTMKGQPARTSEIDGEDKSSSGSLEVDIINNNNQKKSRNKDFKMSRNKRSKSSSDHHHHHQNHHMDEYRLKDFIPYHISIPGIDPSAHLLRNDVPPSVVDLFCQSTNRMKGDAFPLFKEAFYQQHKDRRFQESNKICDLSFKSKDDDAITDGSNQRSSSPHRQINKSICQSIQSAEFSNQEMFWTGYENLVTSDSPKTMLRAVVEELKKKKKKSLSSSSSSHPGDVMKSYHKTSNDSAMDLSTPIVESTIKDADDVTQDHQTSPQQRSSSPPPTSSSSSPQTSSSKSSYSSISHLYGLNPSLFQQSYPHFGFPFYSPYIFMGFPLHPILSPSISKTGFQASFAAPSFHHDASQKLTNPPNHPATHPSIQRTTKGHTNGTCFPPYFKNDVDKPSKTSLSPHLNILISKQEHPNVKNEDKKLIFENFDVIDFSLKSRKDYESKNFEVLDLSRKFDDQGICL